MSGETQGPGALAALASMRSVLERIVMVLVEVILAAMVILVFGNVIFRYFLNFAIAWSSEVSRFLLIWMVFLGAFVAYIHNEHLGLDVMLRYLPRIVSKLLVVLADLLVLGALGVMLDGGINMTVDSFASGWVSPAISLPYGYVYLIGPISAFLMLLEGVLKTAADFATLVRPAREEEHA
ncbi:MAG TPA: TRAP transporter small permease [Spirochaetia bacterium]|nr:TRAP transporter small permease [Spirochaetia bacterium]